MGYNKRFPFWSQLLTSLIADRGTFAGDCGTAFAPDQINFERKEQQNNCVHQSPESAPLPAYSRPPQVHGRCTTGGCLVVELQWIPHLKRLFSVKAVFENKQTPFSWCRDFGGSLTIWLFWCVTLIFRSALRSSFVACFPSWFSKWLHCGINLAESPMVYVDLCLLVFDYWLVIA